MNPQEIEALTETRRIICQAKLVSQMNLFVLLNFDMFILLVILLQPKRVIARVDKQAKEVE